MPGPALSVSAARGIGDARIVPMKQRYMRVGDELADDESVVVRGGELDREIIRSDALRNHAIKRRASGSCPGRSSTRNAFLQVQ